MDRDQENKTVQKVLSGKTLEVESGMILLGSPDKKESSYIIVSVSLNDGEIVNFPLSPNLALQLGEQMLRAADAIAAGNVPKRNA